MGSNDLIPYEFTPSWYQSFNSKIRFLSFITLCCYFIFLVCFLPSLIFIYKSKLCLLSFLSPLFPSLDLCLFSSISSSFSSLYSYFLNYRFSSDLKKKKTIEERREKKNSVKEKKGKKSTCRIKIKGCLNYRKGEYYCKCFIPKVMI